MSGLYVASFSDYKVPWWGVEKELLIAILRTPICGVKRQRKDRGILTFSDDGINMTFNYFLRDRRTAHHERFYIEMLDQVAKYGGKVYLAKHPYLPTEYFTQFYPRYKEFLAIKDKIDPNHFFWSDAAERLFSQRRSGRVAVSR